LVIWAVVNLLGQGLQFAVVEYWIGAVAAVVIVGGLEA
jgi:hypothetical protein